MPKVDIYNLKGEVVGSKELSDEVFASPVRPYLLNEVVVWQRACRRKGTQATLTKGEVTGSTKKPFAQKGRGVARQGSLKNPHQRGGGVAFAPKPRDYSYSMPKSKKRAALSSAVSARLNEGRLRLVDNFSLSEPRTKNVLEIKKNFNLDSCLIVDSKNLNAKLGARNLKSAKYLEPEGLNVEDVLRFPYLMLSVDACQKIEDRLLGNSDESRE